MYTTEDSSFVRYVMAIAPLRPLLGGVIYAVTSLQKNVSIKFASKIKWTTCNYYFIIKDELRYASISMRN